MNILFLSAFVLGLISSLYYILRTLTEYRRKRHHQMSHYFRWFIVNSIVTFLAFVGLVVGMVLQ